jgi:hypothetical protein
MSETRRMLFLAGLVLLLPILVVAWATQGARAQAPGSGVAAEDQWGPVRFLVGRWEGTSEGQPGSGTVQRSYEFILDGRYLHERNTSSYPPRAAGKAGEVHQHWSFLSYDRGRRALVLRQFHQEGFVNQYVMAPRGEPAADVVFESESFENLPAGWKARESYRVLAPDAFEETFELAGPGKPFELYSRARFRRVP